MKELVEVIAKALVDNPDEVAGSQERSGQLSKPPLRRKITGSMWISIEDSI